MSIASEITRINDAKTSIKNSIINKGITVLDTQKIDEYSTLIDSIEIKKPEQSKSTTPSENVQNIIPDNGYTLSQVTVEAISKTYVGSNVTKKSAQTYIPTTTDQTIASGQYLTGTQTIKGDSNLTADNIKSGTSIFGVTGTYEGEGGGDQPQLNTPTISITEDTLTITPNKNNGNFVTGYNVYVNPGTGYVLFGTTTTLTNDLTQYPVPPGDYSIKVTAVGENFIESDYSNELNYTNVFYTVTNTLTNCTSNNSKTSIRKGSAYSATITANSGYSMAGATVSVTMGGTNITETAYSDKTITISEVTGNLIISISSMKGISWAAGTVTHEYRYKIPIVKSGGGVFVGYQWRYDATSSAETSSKLLFSTDGQSWEEKSIDSFATACAAYGAGKFVSLGTSGASYIYCRHTDLQGNTSADKIVVSTSNAHRISAMIYTGTRYIAIGEKNYAICSTDGETWVELSTLPTASGFGNWGALANNGETIVALTVNSAGFYTQTFAYSTDNGDTWTQGTMPIADSWCAITYGNGKFVAITYDKVAVSDDGINWTLTDNEIANLRNIVFGNGLFVITPSSENVCYYSADGISWANTTLPESGDWRALAYGNDKFVAFPFTADALGAYTV